jgi:hypothetical protein
MRRAKKADIIRGRLASLGAVLALTACGANLAPSRWANAESPSNVDRPSRVQRAAVQIQPGARRPGREEELQFDLVCNLRGRMIEDANPWRPGTPSLNRDPWNATERYMIDLRAMRWCDPVSCTRLEPGRIEFADGESIKLYDRPRHSLSISRRDGRYYQRLEDTGTITVVRGRCRKEPFSSFPARQ